MPMYMLSSLSFSPCYRYRYRTAALRAMPMLRYRSQWRCRNTGHAHVDTYGPRPCRYRCDGYSFRHRHVIVIPRATKYTADQHVHMFNMLSLSLSHCRTTAHAHGDKYGPCPCTCRSHRYCSRQQHVILWLTGLSNSLSTRRSADSVKGD